MLYALLADVGVDAELLDLLPQVLAADTERERGVSHVPVVPVESVDDIPALAILQVAAEIGIGRGGKWRDQPFLKQSFRAKNFIAS